MRHTPLKRGAKTLNNTFIKHHAPKKRAGHDKPLLSACRGELCYLRIPGVCIGGIATTVPAHSNQLRHGKGFVMLGKRTSKMSVRTMTDLIEFIHAFGDDHDVVWSPTSLGRAA